MWNEFYFQISFDTFKPVLVEKRFLVTNRMIYQKILMSPTQIIKLDAC